MSLIDKFLEDLTSPVTSEPKDDNGTGFSLSRAVKKEISKVVTDVQLPVGQVKIRGEDGETYIANLPEGTPGKIRRGINAFLVDATLPVGQTIEYDEDGKPYVADLGGPANEQSFMNMVNRGVRAKITPEAINGVTGGIAGFLADAGSGVDLDAGITEEELIARMERAAARKELAGKVGGAAWGVTKLAGKAMWGVTKKVASVATDVAIGVATQGASFAEKAAVRAAVNFKNRQAKRSQSNQTASAAPRQFPDPNVIDGEFTDV